MADGVELALIVIVLLMATGVLALTARLLKRIAAVHEQVLLSVKSSERKPAKKEPDKSPFLGENGLLHWKNALPSSKITDVDRISRNVEDDLNG